MAPDDASRTERHSPPAESSRSSSSSRSSRSTGRAADGGLPDLGTDADTGADADLEADADTGAGPGVSSVGAADTPRRKVGLSKGGVGADGTELVTSGLGSCLGVALYDPEASVGGLLHAMLPAADGRPGDAEKFVVEGTEALVRELAAAGADPDGLRAKLAGGAEMLDLSVGEGEATIGERNVAAAEATLARLSIPVVAADTGGGRGRSLRLDTATGDLHVSYAGAGTVVR